MGFVRISDIKRKENELIECHHRDTKDTLMRELALMKVERMEYECVFSETR